VTKLTKSIETTASPKKVFAFVTDIEKMNEIAKGDVEFKQTSKGPWGVGTTLHWISRQSGSPMEADFEVTEFEKNKKTTMHTVKGSKFKLQQTCIVEPAAKGTKLTYIADYTLPYSILGKIIDKLKVQKDIEKSIDRQLMDGKKILEA
jgi:polyketide cyclase/dehydrase/lipid transport protein